MPLAAPFDERGAAKQLQVARAIGERKAGPAGQVVDAALALSEMLQDFEAMGVSERLRDLREAGKYVLFRTHA